jgi:hypothetical protein
MKQDRHTLVRAAFRPRPAFFVGLLLLLTGCATAPRVIEVVHQQRFQQVCGVDQSYFVTDRASGLPVANPKLPAVEQGEYFRVRWSPGTMDAVRFEYRQAKLPNQISVQTIMPTRGQKAATFAVTGEQFSQGGPVSAWRVSLLRAGQLVAEKHSTLW